MPRTHTLLSSLLLPYLGIAFAAIYRSVLAGLEGHFSFLTALGTYRRVHLAPRLEPAAVLARPLRPALFTASRTTLRLVGIALRLEEFLFFGGKIELNATIDTLKCLVLGNHTG